MTSLPAQMETEFIFPSVTHLKHLRLRLKENCALLKAFSEEERWQFHAYDYAFRLHFLGTDRRESPLDPEGKWFDGDYCTAALAMYRAVS